MALSLRDVDAVDAVAAPRAPRDSRDSRDSHDSHDWPALVLDAQTKIETPHHPEG